MILYLTAVLFVVVKVLAYQGRLHTKFTVAVNKIRVSKLFFFPCQQKNCYKLHAHNSIRLKFCTLLGYPKAIISTNCGTRSLKLQLIIQQLTKIKKTSESYKARSNYISYSMVVLYAYQCCFSYLKLKLKVVLVRVITFS